MKIAEIGCGTGKTTSILYNLAQPGGQAVGFDISEERINFAKENYGKKDLNFLISLSLFLKIINLISFGLDLSLSILGKKLFQL